MKYFICLFLYNLHNLTYYPDYIFVDDDLLLDAKVKMAVVDDVIYDEKFEKKFKVRLIHHIRL